MQYVFIILFDIGPLWSLKIFQKDNIPVCRLILNLMKADFWGSRVNTIGVTPHGKMSFVLTHWILAIVYNN